MPNKAYSLSICPGIPRLGPCPKGWMTLTYGDVLRVVQRPAELDDDREYQLINVKRNRGGIVPRSRLKGKDIKTKTQFFVNSGDFLIANRQIVHGACGVVPEKLEGAIVSNEYTTFRPKDELCLPFFEYFTHSIHFQQTCFHSSIGVDVEKMVFKLNWWLNHKFHLPQIREQKKVADIILTWDEAILETRNLIRAKIHRKKALMQQLLTEKKRLAGFSEPWKEYPLGELASVIFSNVDKKVAHDEIPVRLCNYLDVYYNDRITVGMNLMKATARDAEIAKYKLAKDDVIITKDSETAADIAVPCYVAEEVEDLVCGYHLAIIRPNSRRLHGPFLSYLLMTDKVHYQFVRIANGVTRFGLTNGSVKKIRVSIPSVDEQSRISEVLFMADEEIRILETKLSSLEKQKRGLIQKLLTGEVRVKV